MSAKDKKEKKTDKHIQELEEKIEQLTQEKQDTLEKLQRLSADYTNYQRRVPRQIADNVAFEKRAIVRALLPSLDNFEHALAGFVAGENDVAMQKVIDGMRLIFDHLLDALKSLGVEKSVSVGQSFDPSCHEAMMQRSDPDKENGVVLEEYLPCYRMGADVLRPAKVIVNKLQTAAPAEPQAVSQSPDNEPDNEPADETADNQPEEQQ